MIRDPRGQLGLHRLTLLDEDLTRHEDDHTSGPGVIGGHAVVVSKHLRPSAHEPSSMGQPRELRGDRRRHASPVKLLTQAKTTGSLIQRLSLRGMTTTSAETARTNVANQQICSTKLQHPEHGSSRPRGVRDHMAVSPAAPSPRATSKPLEAQAVGSGILGWGGSPTLLLTRPRFPGVPLRLRRVGDRPGERVRDGEVKSSFQRGP